MNNDLSPLSEEKTLSEFVGLRFSLIIRRTKSLENSSSVVVLNINANANNSL